MRSSTTGRADPLLLLEVVLVLALFGLAVALYLIPSAREPFVPHWWTPLLLGALFFGVLALDVYRRRRARHAGLHRAVREDAQRLSEEERTPQA